MQGRREFGFEGDHARVCVGIPARYARNQATTAYAHQHRIRCCAGLPVYFSSQRACTKDHLDLIVGMREQGTRFRLAGQAGRQRFGIRCSRNMQGGAQRFEARLLGGR